MSEIINQQYRVLQELGNGNFARTCLVENIQHPEAGRAVLKLLKPNQPTRRLQTLAKTLFDQEVQILKELELYRSTPSLLAEFNQDGAIGLVQTFIEGTSVQKTFHRNLFWDEGQLVSFLTATLRTLGLLHDAGFVHRDLNPAHWIQPFDDSSLTLIDFNGAQKLKPLEACKSTIGVDREPDIATAFVIGTSGYMAPEQMQGHADVRSDLYALGLIAIQGVTGRSPSQFGRNIQGEICWQPLMPLRIELIDILTHLVRYRPQARYSSAAEALQEVHEYAQPRWSQRLTKWWEPKRSPLQRLAS
jgi:eukaryotic-like serine/threonine-protein kinase